MKHKGLISIGFHGKLQLPKKDSIFETYKLVLHDGEITYPLLDSKNLQTLTSESIAETLNRLLESNEVYFIIDGEASRVFHKRYISSTEIKIIDFFTIQKEIDDLIKLKKVMFSKDYAALRAELGFAHLVGV